MIVIANVLQPLIDFAHEILKFWHDNAGLSWGLSIIMLTVCIRLLILPLTFRQVKSMQRLQQHMPEMKKIQERYKEDRQRLNQEMMKFYQENQVNPLSSCFPILLQLPFFISLFYLLRSDEFQTDIEGEESFLFIPDLADPVTDKPGILAILIVLYVATQLGASAITAISADKNQRRIMLALPFVFVIFIINFEAGLIVYWITTNVWTIGQQLAVKKFMPAPPKLESSDYDDKPKAARGKPVTAPAVAEDGKGSKQARTKADKQAKAKAKSGEGNGGPRKAPPSAPRKKKKRTGRRR